MIFRKVTFTGSTGKRLTALLDLPEGRAPEAYAMFAHCFTCSKNIRAAGHVSRSLAREGIAVLRFDFTGLGESEGDFSETTFSSNVDDLVAAAGFLKERFEAPKILVGHSLGGAAVLQAAGRIESVRAVATIGAPADPRHVERLFGGAAGEIREKGEAAVFLEGRSFTIKKKFLEDLDGTRMAETIRAMKKPLIIFHSPVDEVVGVENAAEIFKAAMHPKSFVSLDRADHLLTREEDSRYVGTVIAAWARKYADLENRDPAETSEKGVFARIGEKGYFTDITAAGHALSADEPVSVGGTGRGPTPYDLLSAALSACTAMTLRMYADRKKWPLEGVSVHVSHEKVHAEDCESCGEKAQKVDRFTRTVEVAGDLDDAQRKRLLEIADRCPVHRTLESSSVIRTRAGEVSGDGALEEQRTDGETL